MNKNHYILTLFIFLMTIAGCAEPHSQENPISLEDQFSKHIGQGKWTIVNIWSPSCPSCRMEMPDLQDFHDAHKDQDASVLGIAIAFPSFGYPNPQTIKDFTRDYFVDYPSLLADAEQASTIVGEYITMIPVTFFFNPEGELVDRWQGTIKQQEIEEMMKRSLENPVPYVSSLRLE